ncbi:unnamed protein product [Cunninghamella echinulata]
MCDGSYCQLVLDQKNQSLKDEWHQDSISMKEESYNRCALEIHISLENKLKSFQSRYLELNNQYENQSSTIMKGLPIMPLLKDPSNHHCNNNTDIDDEQPFQSHVEIITYPPDHLKEKATPPLPSGSQKSKATTILSNNNSNHTLTSTSTAISSSSSSSTLFKKKNNIFTRTLLNRSSATKDKWLKLLSFQQQSMNNNNNNNNKNNQYLQSHTSLSKIKENKNDETTENEENKKTNKDYIHTYYYTIPCTYTPFSSINTTNTTINSLKNQQQQQQQQQQQNTSIIIIDQVQSLKGKQKYKEFPRQDSSLYMDDDDDDDDDDEYQNNNTNTNTTTSPISTTTPTTSISDQSILKDEEEENQQQLEDEEKKKRNDQQRQQQLYNRFQKLKLPWHYAITNHIYATQFMLDLPLVLDEYINWETSLQQQQNPHHSDYHDMTPLLALDWPKNWTCSQL